MENGSEQGEVMSKNEPHLYTEQPKSGLGTALGLLCCGLCLLAFPHLVGMINWLSWIFYGIGLLFLLVGVFGACSVLFE